MAHYHEHYGHTKFINNIKRKEVYIPLTLLIILIPAIISILSCSPIELYNYITFLKSGVVISIFSFSLPIILGALPKKKQSFNVRGFSGIPEGTEIVIRTHHPRYNYVSKRLLNNVLAIGVLISAIGFGYGFYSADFGFILLVAGWFTIGIGTLFYFKPIRA